MEKSNRTNRIQIKRIYCKIRLVQRHVQRTLSALALVHTVLLGSQLVSRIELYCDDKNLKTICYDFELEPVLGIFFLRFDWMHLQTVSPSCSNWF